MSDQEKKLKDEELDKVSGGVQSVTNPGIMHTRPESAAPEEIDPDVRVHGGGGGTTHIGHTPQ
jgi:hypothetical protein